MVDPDESPREQRRRDAPRRGVVSAAYRRLAPVSASASLRVSASLPPLRLDKRKRSAGKPPPRRFFGRNWWTSAVFSRYAFEIGVSRWHHRCTHAKTLSWR